MWKLNNMSLLILTIMYFVPTIIAVIRGHKSVMAIAATNIILGWTVFGWIAAFIWSLANKGQSLNVTMNNHNNLGN